jgi:hypothetical protein
MDRSNPGHATVIDGKPVTLPDLYHPTFLYEAIWDVATGLFVYLLDRRYKFGRGRAFALYAMAYTAGRGWIEMLRVDEANRIFGVRLNVFTSILVFVLALIYFLVVKGPREYVVPVDAPETEPEPAAESDVSAVDVGGEKAARGPKAYQVVSAERFQAYQRTGILPPPDPEQPQDDVDQGDPAEKAGSSTGSADEG